MTAIQPPLETPSTDRLALTLFIATAIHAVVILGVTFGSSEHEDDQQNPPVLDITVVNRSDSPPPEEYDYLADSSQDGAGNTAEKVKPKQEMIMQAPPVTSSKATPATPQVLTRERSPEKSMEKPEPPKPEQDSRHTDATELINRSMEMLTLNQQINQSLQAYSKTPKSKFISARTKEFKYSNYMRDWVAKVERVGELNYPDAARRQHLSGKLIVQVALYPDGTVREITIRKPSGHKILDDAAVRIVKLAAPFAPFPENIREETDVLYITRTWVFTSGNRLHSQ